MTTARFEARNQLGEIVLDSPPLNLFSESLIRDLHNAVEQAAANDIRALLFRANGDVFSGGADVSIFAGVTESEAEALMIRVSALINALEALPIPTIALIHGRCLAGALEVALACDLIWAAAGTQIGQVEAVIGGFPFAGGTQRLASRIGMARAAEMVLGARIYPAEQLAAWGLIGRVVPADALVREGQAFATQLAMGPTLAHVATKRILRAWRSGGVAAADEITRAEAPEVILSHDLQEGIASLRRSGPSHATSANE
jgi:enoyl-CoA hydratase